MNGRAFQLDFFDIYIGALYLLVKNSDALFTEAY